MKIVALNHTTARTVEKNTPTNTNKKKINMPTAYIYEQRIMPSEDEWKETTSIEHPEDIAKESDIETEKLADYRNVRPLFEPTDTDKEI